MLQDFKSVSEEGACISIGEEDDSPHIPPTNAPSSAPCNDITKVSPTPLGKPNPPKTDEFSEKFQTAFDPPPSFSENHIADFLKSCTALKTIHVVYF